jgi:hypothetical protein
MKKLWVSLLALGLLLGQAPAWAMVCSQRCMPQASLVCLRACAKSKALLTHNGALPSVGQSCGQVQVRLAQPSLAAVTAPAMALPVSTYAPPLTVAVVHAAEPFIVSQAHAPPCAGPAQAFLSVPVAQAPPAALLSV